MELVGEMARESWSAEFCRRIGGCAAGGPLDDSDQILDGFDLPGLAAAGPVVVEFVSAVVLDDGPDGAGDEGEENGDDQDKRHDALPCGGIIRVWGG
jgi:hypothetical protein